MPKRNLSELVLDSIDTIRKRKNRPNLLRIFAQLSRLYDLDIQTCEQLIQTLVTEGQIVKVLYKGHISYRNAFKYKRNRLYLKKKMGSELPSALLMNAISELVVREPDYLNIGVPYNILEEHLMSMQGVNITKDAIHELLHKEIKLESILRYENGNIFIRPKSTSSIENSNSKYRQEKLNIEGFSPTISAGSSLNLISINASSLPEHKNSSKERVISEVNRSSYEVVNNNIRKEVHVNSVPNFESNKQTLSNKEKLDISPDNNSFYNNVKTSQGFNKNFSGITDKYNYSTITKDITLLPTQGISDRELLDSNRMNVAKSSTLEEDIPSQLIQVKGETDLGSSNSENNIKTHDIGEILGMNIEDVEGKDKSLGTIKSNGDLKCYKSEPSVEEQNIKEAPNSLILQRARRKPKTKYDASDYYFPSLKRKSRDSDGEKKDDRKKKKKKKENCPTNLSGVFAKRYMFPGNTSMCCECRCYGSKVKADPMITCSSCSNMGHQSCVTKMMDGKNWCCVDCQKDTKLCRICERSQQKTGDMLYTCNSCGDHYHKECHYPAIKQSFSSWYCNKCPPVDGRERLKKKETHQKDDSMSKTKTNVVSRKRLTSVNYFEDNPPDYSCWTCEDVYNYFKKYFSEEIAKGLYEQDIDGASIKLMEREDVLNLNFPLGLRLKILMHLRRLQRHSNNLSEIWCS